MPTLHTTVVGLSVSLLVFVNPAKMAEPNALQFGGEDSSGPKNHVLEGFKIPHGMRHF